MVVNELCKAIHTFCEDKLKELLQPIPDKVTEMRPGSLNPHIPLQQSEEEYDIGHVKHITVFTGYLPPKRKSDSDDYPFLLIVPVSGSYEDGVATAKVQLYAGSWHNGSDGFTEVMNIIERLSQAFMSMPFSRLENRYILEPPLNWVFPDVSQQAGAPKMWQAVLTTDWTFTSSTNNLPLSTEYPY